jgi:hypothetical protein
MKSSQAVYSLLEHRRQYAFSSANPLPLMQSGVANSRYLKALAQFFTLCKMESKTAISIIMSMLSANSLAFARIFAGNQSSELA